MKILIIDDSGMVRKSIRRFAMAEFPEAEYIPANNGKEGINQYIREKLVNKTGAPDLVFLDMLMPEMDGMETLRHLIAFDPQAYVVIVTSDIQPIVKDRAMRLGAKQFLNKPFTEESMAEVATCWRQSREVGA